MYNLEQTGGFKKDIKLAKKRGLNMQLLDVAVTKLVLEGKLPVTYKPHILKGYYKGLWECHLQPDWLLVWEQNETYKTYIFSKDRNPQRLILVAFFILERNSYPKVSAP